MIRSGREFEQEYRLDASEAGEFLVDLGEQLREDDELTTSTEEWKLPFGELVELEIDYDGVGEPELEIEVELPGRTDESVPDIR